MASARQAKPQRRGTFYPRAAARPFYDPRVSVDDDFETYERPIVSLKSDRAGGYFIEPSSVMPWDEAFEHEPIHFLPSRAAFTSSQSRFTLAFIAKLEAEESARLAAARAAKMEAARAAQAAAERKAFADSLCGDVIRETAADVAVKYKYVRARFYFTDGSSVEAQYDLTTEKGQTAWRNDTSRHEFVVLETN